MGKGPGGPHGPPRRGVFKISWNEPTGTCVSVANNLNENRAHGATFFPRGIELEPKKIIGFQNEKIDLMRQYRDAGPTYPILVVDEFAEITFVEDCGRDDESVIACGPEDLPAGLCHAPECEPTARRTGVDGRSRRGRVRRRQLDRHTPSGTISPTANGNRATPTISTPEQCEREIMQANFTAAGALFGALALAAPNAQAEV